MTSPPVKTVPTDSVVDEPEEDVECIAYTLESEIDPQVMEVDTPATQSVPSIDNEIPSLKDGETMVPVVDVQSSSIEESAVPVMDVQSLSTDLDQPAVVDEISETSPDSFESPESLEMSSDESDSTSSHPTPPRRSGRVRQEPVRYRGGDFMMGAVHVKIPDSVEQAEDLLAAVINRPLVLRSMLPQISCQWGSVS